MNVSRDKNGSLEWMDVASWPDGGRLIRSVGSDCEFWERQHGLIKFFWHFRGKDRQFFLRPNGEFEGPDDWRYLTLPQAERLAWLLSGWGVAVPDSRAQGAQRVGQFSLPDDELTLYIMLGENPYLWPAVRLRSWLEERVAGT